MTDPRLEEIRRDRLTDNLWTLVGVPSPTTRERDVAFAYAELLDRSGADVTVDETLHDSPNVIGRLRGRLGSGPVLQLAGHLDHIDVPHDEPQRTEEIISGRGSADMKNGLAGALEVVRVLDETGRDFAGELLVTAYGLHEAPLGDAKGLMNLIDAGVTGDAAIVCEGPADKALVMGKGQSIWNLRLTRTGRVCHELRRDPQDDALLESAGRLLNRLLQYRDELASAPHEYPLLGPQSLFVGQVHYGDFYNRVPATAFLQGTRRWHPDRTFEDAQAELAAIVDTVPLPDNVSVDQWWTFVGDSYAFDPAAPIVTSLQDAFRAVTGEAMEIGGSSTVFDANRLVPFGGIPAVPIGFGTDAAHADYEFVRLSQVEQACRIALEAAVRYFGP